MILYLTSSPTGDLDGKYQCKGFDTRNDFRERLASHWPNGARCLMITASPADHAGSVEMTYFFQVATYLSGLNFTCFDLWDGTTTMKSREEVQSYDVIFLGGGHVPTQNAFFHHIGLSEKIAGFDGIIVGISAGSMNCADRIYAQPEEPGEAVDPHYVRWLTGLGLTDLNILPHFQMVKDKYLDGMHLFREITVPDKGHRRFLALVDGSYVEIENGEERYFGDCIWL